MVSRGLYVNRTSGGRYHVRVGSTKRDLTPPELARLFQQRGREYVFDEQAVRTATVDDLNRNRLEAFFGRSPTIPWGIALPQQVRQGHAVEGGNRPAHHRRNAVALEMVHEQVGRGGQVRDRAAALRGHAAPPPFSDRLSAHAEQAGRLGLTQAPLKAGNASERCPSRPVRRLPSWVIRPEAQGLASSQCSVPQPPHVTGGWCARGWTAASLPPGRAGLSGAGRRRRDLGVVPRLAKLICVPWASAATSRKRLKAGRLRAIASFYTSSRRESLPQLRPDQGVQRPPSGRGIVGIAAIRRCYR